MSRVLSSRQRRVSSTTEEEKKQSLRQSFFVHFACPHILAYNGALSALKKHIAMSPGLLFMQFDFNTFFPCEDVISDFIMNVNIQQHVGFLSSLSTDKVEINKFRALQNSFLLKDDPGEDNEFARPPSIPLLTREALNLAILRLISSPRDTSIPSLSYDQMWLLSRAFSKSTLLHYACAGDQAETVAYLLEKAKSSSSILNKSRHSAEYYTDIDSIKESVWKCLPIRTIEPTRRKSSLISRASRKSMRDFEGTNLLELKRLNSIVAEDGSNNAVLESKMASEESTSIGWQTSHIKNRESSEPGDDRSTVSMATSADSSKRSKLKYRRSNSIIESLRRKDNPTDSKDISTSDLLHQKGLKYGTKKNEESRTSGKVVLVEQEKREKLPTPAENMLCRVIGSLSPIESLAEEMIHKFSDEEVLALQNELMPSQKAEITSMKQVVSANSTSEQKPSYLEQVFAMDPDPDPDNEQIVEKEMVEVARPSRQWRSASAGRSASRGKRQTVDYHNLSFREMIWHRAALVINEPAVTLGLPKTSTDVFVRGKVRAMTSARSKSVARCGGWREERSRVRMRQQLFMQLKEEKEGALRQGRQLMRREFGEFAELDEWPALRRSDGDY